MITNNSGKNDSGTKIVKFKGKNGHRLFKITDLMIKATDIQYFVPHIILIIHRYLSDRQIQIRLSSKLNNERSKNIHPPLTGPFAGVVSLVWV